MRIKGKKLAMEIRQSDQILIEKVGNDYWISDTHIAVKVSEIQFQKFFEKLLNYKDFEEISNDPFYNFQDLIEITQYDKVKVEKKDRHSIEILKQKAKDLKNQDELLFTDFIIKSYQSRLFKSESGRPVLLNTDYSWLLDQLEENPNVILKQEKKLTQINILNKSGSLEGFIMPMRKDKLDEKFDQLKEMV